MSGAARELARAGMVVTGALFVSRILGWVRVAVIAASVVARLRPSYLRPSYSRPS